MPGKVLFVLTSHDKLVSGKPTGWFLPEAAHPYEEVTKAGYDVVFASPKGGKAPLDPNSVEMFKDDAVCQQFQSNAKAQEGVSQTIKLADVDVSDYLAALWVGGHGPMFESEDKDVIRVATEFYNKSVLAAVCHGPGALVNVKTQDGKSIWEGVNATGFSDAECAHQCFETPADAVREEQMGLTKEVPFLLETRLRELGARYSKNEKAWGSDVQVAGRLLTGANPNSATPLGQAIVKAIKA